MAMLGIGVGGFLMICWTTLNDDPHRLDPRRDRRPVRPAVRSTCSSRRSRPPRASRAERGPASTLLRSRPAAARRIAAIARSRRSRDRAQGDQADGRRARCCRRRRRRRTPARSRFCMGAAWRNPKDRDMPALVEMVEGRAGDGAGDLHDAGHADAESRPSGSPMRGSIITTTISTPRPSIMARSSPRGPSRTGSIRWTHVRDAGHQRVLRRHRRHGRDARGPGRLHPRARHPAAPSRKRADQRAGAGQGHGAGRHARRHAAGEDRRHRVRPHRRGGADHHAAEHGAALAPGARA